MNINRFSQFLLLAFFSVSISSCEKKDPEVSTPEDKISAEALSANSFILDYMDYFYLWSEEVPKGLDVTSYEDSKEFFNEFIYEGTSENYDKELEANSDGDSWSFITDDLQGLLDYFNGIRTTSGYYPYSYLIEEGSENLVLVVAYVYDNSPASDASLKRGSVIMQIDGKDLTAQNVNELYSQESYSITMGEFDFNTKKFVLLNETKTITKAEIDTNPIIKSEIYNIDGVKVAYLLYNSFIHSYDNQLISEFEKYKAEGVTELVLDLRYNGGGAVTSALNIASMIAPKSAIGEVFLKKQFNTKLQAEFINDPNYGESYLENNLSDKAYGNEDDGGIIGTSLPNLNLNRVYILGLNGTASSSEIVINGLEPYMTVMTVGEKTYGKNVASTTFQNKEYPNWAIQPIIFKSANADGKSDYWNGIAARIAAEDNPIYGDFGYDNINETFEPMLHAALADIAGIVTKKQAFDDIGFKIENMPVENPRLNTIMIYDIKNK